MMTGPKRSSGQTAKVRLQTKPRLDFSVAQLVLTCFGPAKPDGHLVMHRDDNRSNNDIKNLMWGTPADNAIDMAMKKRGGGQKLGPLEVRQIQTRRAAGESGRALAKEYGVSEQRICDIFRGRTCLG
jgi:hypothetical protein